MLMDKKSKIILIISIISFALAITAVTYAYFSAKITGIESASTISLNAGTMGIHYAEGNENVSISDMYPRSEPWITKTFTLTGNNTTDQTMEYEVGLDIITNTFKGGQLSFSLEVGSNNVGTSMSPVNYKSITKPNGTMLIGHGAFPGPVTNGVQTYTLKIYFLDNGKNQNINQGAVFNAKITVQDRGTIAVDNSCTTYRTETITTIESYDINYDNCMTYLEENPLLHATEEQEQQYCNGDEVTVSWTIFGRTRTMTYSIEKSLQADSTQLIEAGVVTNAVINSEEVTTDLGSPYTEGGYTYTYYENENGWRVNLSGNSASSKPPCVVINDQPVVSMANLFKSLSTGTIDLSGFDTTNITNMSYMFQESNINTINLGSIDTSNVTTMQGMFLHTQTTSIQNLNTLNTSNVTNMRAMFQGASATTLDLSGFNTSNVTDMQSMFSGSAATTLDLSSLNTSNVTNMSSMFSSSQASSINLSSFNTSNVTNMGSMFLNSSATTLDLSSFNTSNVTTMGNMFEGSAATNIDLSSFNTSNVTSMQHMFSDSAATNINLSSFDTSNVTTMESMFEKSQATILDLSSFNTSNVTNMRYMFKNSAATSINLSSFNTSNVTNMHGMFHESAATILDLSLFDTSNVSDMAYMFNNSTNLEKIYATNLFVTTKVSTAGGSDLNMFAGCTNLVGGAGTTYNSNYVGKAYAHIDGGQSNPGYFTLKP